MHPVVVAHQMGKPNLMTRSSILPTAAFPIPPRFRSDPRGHFGTNRQGIPLIPLTGQVDSRSRVGAGYVSAVVARASGCGFGGVRDMKLNTVRLEGRITRKFSRRPTGWAFCAGGDFATPGSAGSWKDEQHKIAATRSQIEFAQSSACSCGCMAATLPADVEKCIWDFEGPRIPRYLPGKHANYCHRKVGRESPYEYAHPSGLPTRAGGAYGTTPDEPGTSHSRRIR
jgi:hypothetical protein